MKKYKDPVKYCIISGHCWMVLCRSWSNVRNILQHPATFDGFVDFYVPIFWLSRRSDLNAISTMEDFDIGTDIVLN